MRPKPHYGRALVRAGLGPMLLVIPFVALAGCQDGVSESMPSAAATRSAIATASSEPSRDDSETISEVGALTTEGPDSTSSGSGQDPSAAVYQANMSRCMSERGWDVVVGTEPGYQVDVPEDQTEQFFADHEACLEFFGFPSGPVQVTPQEASALYVSLLEVADCVRSEGYEVEEPPSERAFVEALVSNPIPIWHPYYVVEGMGKSAADELTQACPVEVG